MPRLQLRCAVSPLDAEGGNLRKMPPKKGKEGGHKAYIWGFVFNLETIVRRRCHTSTRDVNAWMNVTGAFWVNQIPSSKGAAAVCETTRDLFAPARFSLQMPPRWGTRQARWHPGSQQHPGHEGLFYLVLFSSWWWHTIIWATHWFMTFFQLLKYI